MSQRHQTSRPEGDADPIGPEDDPVLDAVRACVLAVGIRRTTATDIARRAGVSRMTLYRRFPDVQSMIAALMTREFTGVVRDAARDAAEREPARERIVAGAIEGAARIASHPLWARIVDVDPELLLPYVIQRLGGVQEAGLALLSAQIRAGRGDGSIRDGDPDVMAATIELALRAHVLSWQSRTPEERDRSAAELARMVDGYLRPDREEAP